MPPQLINELQRAIVACNGRLAAAQQKALIKFIEALAIADARRDHIFESERLMKNHLDPAGEKRISSGIRDETRSDLCSVLDRAKKRKID